MMVAEHIGDHAHCPECRAYARFSVVDAGRALHQEPAPAGRARRERILALRRDLS